MVPAEETNVDAVVVALFSGQDVSFAIKEEHRTEGFYLWESYLAIVPAGFS